VSFAAAIDVGGTFTDVAIVTSSSELVTLKTATTPEPLAGVFAGLTEACEHAGLSVSDTSSFMYGMTEAVNALLTRSGARVGLLTTAGFGQILHLARSQTPGPLVGWLNMTKAEPLADLADTREIDERMLASGVVEKPLDEAQVLESVRELADSGITVFAVGLLHSYANPEHERRVASIIREFSPDAQVTISSDVLPEYREYDRVATTVANAYVLPKLARHVSELERELRSRSIACPVSIIRSDGGHMSATAALRRPADTLFSGPSGGVVGALAVAKAAGYPNILTFDMGGTSTDVALCRDGEVPIARELEVAELPLSVTGVDISSIGAGGGSIAYIPSTMKSLRVGPRSAGAAPGPASYGRGGEEPTVTDANVVLGRLPKGLLGGEFELDADAALQAVERVSASLSMSAEATARGVIDIVNEKMAGALRLISVGRGLDPSDFALVAFGGAGPLHANALAALLGCFPVIIPPSPGVQSALGFHTADRKMTFSATRIAGVDPGSWPAIESLIRQVGDEAKAWLVSESCEDGLVEYSCDVRFVRQGYEVEVAFGEEEIDDGWPDRIATRFSQAHQQLYGFVPNAPAELVTVRAQGRSPSRFTLPEGAYTNGHGGGDAVIETAPVIFDAGTLDTKIVDRMRLAPAQQVEGPALIVQPDTTTLVLPGYTATVDPRANILIQPAMEAQR
jgi:N-methylhydantoinase A